MASLIVRFMRSTWLQALVIAGAVAWIYVPVLHGTWLWDDNVDITDNVVTRSPTGLWKIWFEPGTQLDVSVPCSTTG